MSLTLLVPIFSQRSPVGFGPQIDIFLVEATFLAMEPILWFNPNFFGGRIHILQFPNFPGSIYILSASTPFSLA
jgi:hypothetical protein